MSNYATVEQPNPVKTKDSKEVLTYVLTYLAGFDRNEEQIAKLRTDLILRSDLGKERYGTRLYSHNGRSAIIDLYQELLDAYFYTTQAIMEGKEVKEARAIRMLVFSALSRVRELLGE